MVVKFTDLQGEPCEVRIGSDQTSSSFVYASPQSFVVEEESSDDMSVPVRTQSGNINIIDVEDDWTALLPIDGGVKPVYFYRGGTCLWKGYVNSGTFGSPYLDIAPMVSIPVVCPLTMLDAVDFRPGLAIDTVEHFLNDIFSLGDHQTITLSYVITSQDATAITSLKMMGSTFYNIYSDRVPEPKYSCLDALREICTICGLTARWTGTTVILEGLPMTASDSPTPLTMPYADANQEQRYVPGWRKVTVKPSEDEIDVVFEMPDRSMVDTIVADAGNITFDDYDRGLSRPNDGVYIWIAGEYGGQYTEFSLSSQTLIIHAPNYNYSNYYSEVAVYDRYEAQDIANPQQGKGSFQWASVIYLTGAGGSLTNHEVCIEINTVQEFAMANGFIVISAGTVNAYETSNDAGSILCTLRVGDDYWAGESWVRYETPFSIPFKDGKIANNRELSSVWGDYEGYGIFVGNAGVSGPITLKIYDVSSIAHSNVVGLANLKMGFVRKEDYSINGERKFVSENGKKFLNMLEITPAFCSDNPTKTLSNVLLDANNAPVREITIGQEDKTPEQWLADNLATYGNKARHCLKLNMRGNLANVTDYSIGTANYHCFAASHDYAENSTTLNLIEI